MPSVALARPMWPATLRALRELTRLALATLVLAVGLGGAAATDQPGRSTATDLPARPVAATVAAQPAVEPVRPAVKPVRAAADLPARPAQVVASTAPPARPEHADTAPAAAVPAHHFAAPHAATGEGEPTRRGPPSA